MDIKTALLLCRDHGRRVRCQTWLGGWYVYWDVITETFWQDVAKVANCRVLLRPTCADVLADWEEVPS